MKRCARCKEHFSIKEFQQPCGRIVSYCRSCRLEYQRERNTRKLAGMKKRYHPSHGPRTSKWCPRCERDLPIENFTSGRIISGYCRPCRNEYARWLFKRSRSAIPKVRTRTMVTKTCPVCKKDFTVTYGMRHLKTCGAHICVMTARLGHTPKTPISERQRTYYREWYQQKKLDPEWVRHRRMVQRARFTQQTRESGEYETFVEISVQPRMVS